MSAGTWKVVRHSETGRYRAAKFGGEVIEYHCSDGAREPWSSAKLSTARDKVLILNSRTPTRPLYSPTEFASMVRHTTMRPRTIEALRDIMVDGRTWVRTAKVRGITESGISRAMRRLHQLNPGTGGS